MIIAIVKATILAGRHDALRAIAGALQYEYAPHEDGCELYESFIDGDTFITLERWRDQDALDKHLKSAHVARLVPQLRQCVEGASFDVQIIKSDDVTFARL